MVRLYKDGVDLKSPQSDIKSHQNRAFKNC